MNSTHPMTVWFAVTAETSSLHRLRADIRRALEADAWGSAAIDAVVLAVDEACANLIRHGYQSRAGATIDVGLSLEDTAVVITVADTAIPFNPHDHQPADVTCYLNAHRTAGVGHGLGLVLMFELMDAIDYVPAPDVGGVNRLILTKRRG